MTIRKVFSIMTLCLFVTVMTSCQSKEEMVIRKINKLADRVEQKADSFSNAEWKKALSDFEDLQEEALECHFDKQQLKQFAKADARLTAVFVKKGAGKLGDELQEVLDKGKEILNGLLDGLRLGFGDEDE